MKANQKNYIYIITDRNNKFIYIGVTSDLVKRLHQHKTKFYKGYSSQHNLYKLVYFESFQWIVDAISREKQLKSYRREKKDNLINTLNPNWDELLPPTTISSLR
jgi:putative endonuclease